MRTTCSRLVVGGGLWLALVAGGLAGLGTERAMAQDGPAQQPEPSASSAPASQPGVRGSIARPPREENRARAELRLYAGGLLDADFSDAPGGVSRMTGGGAVEVDLPMTEGGALGFSFGGRFDSYEFEEGSLGVAAPATPWDDVRTYDAGVSWADRIDEQWGYRLGAFVRSSGEEGADFSDSLTYGGFGAVSYAFSRTLILGLGVGVASRLEDDARVFPVPFVRWQIDDKWLLSSDRSTNLGGLALTYQATEQWRVGVVAGFDTMELRLRDEGPVAGGVGEHSVIPVGAIVTWDATEQLSITATAGAAIWQEYELSNRDGEELAKEDTDLTPVLGLAVTLRF